MVEKKPKKEKVEIVTRAPQKRGIFDNLGKDRQPNVKHPFSEIVNFPGNSEAPEPDPTQPDPSIPKYTQPDPSIPKYTQPNSAQAEISPLKNFTKIPNSIIKIAIPDGLFKGLSRHTYDVFYKRTRGAINPTRRVQMAKSEIMQMTGLSFNTVQTHIKYLKEAGLIRVETNAGKHEGSIYEVLVPEELEDPTQVYPTQPNPTQPNPSIPNPTQKLGILGLGNPLENKGLSDSLILSLKTKTDDDDNAMRGAHNARAHDAPAHDARATLAGFVEILDDASRRLTGRGITKSDADKWRTFAELLVLELEIASKKTSGVSNVPAFLTEICRRKFLNVTPPPSKRAKTDTVGKPENAYEIKPLGKSGRETALEQLREFAGTEFLNDFAKWYTAEDWAWLIENLGENRETEKSS